MLPSTLISPPILQPNSPDAYRTEEFSRRMLAQREGKFISGWTNENGRKNGTNVNGKNKHCAIGVPPQGAPVHRLLQFLSGMKT